MPVVMKLKNWGEPPVPMYEPPLYYVPDMDGEFVRSLRAHYARERDAMLALQKQFGREPETARFFKTEAGHLLKFWRAADAWFKWATGADGWSPPSTWPIELASYFDQVCGNATNNPPKTQV